MPDDTESQLGRRTFLKATGAAGAAATVGATQVAMADPTDRPEDELLVTVSGAASVQTAEVEIQEALPTGANVVWRNDNMNVMSVVTPEGASTQATDRIKRQLESRADVKWVEENQIHDLHAVDDPGLDQQYAPQQTNAVDVFADGFLGSTDIDVAIFDTGVDYNHDDLSAQFGRNKGIAPGDRGTDDPMDDRRHGTHVAGIASATTDNGTGIAGQSNSRLWAVKVFPNASSRTTIDSLDWAIQQGIDVVNGSYGGGRPTNAEQQAFQRALDNGVLPFFSAGNDGPTRDSVSYPGAYPETICVSALQEGGSIARFSSRGPEVDITGPGAQVLSTVPGNSYDSLSGTSMSSPAVAGATALAWGSNPSASASQVRATIFQTARNIGLPETQQGNGLVDAKAAYDQLRDGEDPPEDPPEDPEEPNAVIQASTGDPSVGEDVQLDGTDSASPNGQIVEYAWDANPGGSVTGSTAVLSRDEPVSVDVTLTITDEAGATDSTTRTFDFGESGPSCGEEDYTGSADGSISWWNNSDTYSFSTQTSNPCQVEFDLDGPSDADFDLFVTFDGRTPTPDDFDASSESSDANETIMVDVPEDTSSVDFGILVQGIAGWGSYTLNVEELGF